MAVAGVGAGRAASVGALVRGGASGADGATDGAAAMPTPTTTASATTATATEGEGESRGRCSPQGTDPTTRIAGRPSVLLALELAQGVEDQAHGRSLLARQARPLARGQCVERHPCRGPSRPSATRLDFCWKRATAAARSGSLKPSAARDCCAASRAADALARTAPRPPHDGILRPEAVELVERHLDLRLVADRDARRSLVEPQQRGEAGVAPRGVRQLEYRGQVEGAELLELGAQRRPRERPAAPHGLDARRRRSERGLARQRAHELVEPDAARRRWHGRGRRRRGRDRLGRGAALGACARRGAKAKTRTASSSVSPKATRPWCQRQGPRGGRPPPPSRPAAPSRP